MLPQLVRIDVGYIFELFLCLYMEANFFNKVS